MSASLCNLSAVISSQARSQHTNITFKGSMSEVARKTRRWKLDIVGRNSSGGNWFKYLTKAWKSCTCGKRKKNTELNKFHQSTELRRIFTSHSKIEEKYLYYETTHRGFKVKLRQAKQTAEILYVAVDHQWLALMETSLYLLNHQHLTVNPLTPRSD